MALTGGEQAPDFELSSHRGGTVSRIAWSKVYDIPQQPDNAEIFAALDTLR